jgi:peptidoglycan/LPS O-acetylase OafA/YrhL
MTPTRLESLTGLRFFAALAVFFHHTFAASIVPGGLARVPGTQHLADTGMVGVTFFFVLSGFVLAWSYDDTLPRSGFYGRRFARVWPLHALTTAAAVLLVLPLLDRPQTGAGALLAALLLVQAWSWAPTVYFAANGPSWSLSCEAFFYAVLPFLVPLARRGRGRAAVVTVVGCVLLLAVVPLVVRAVTDTRSALLSLWVFPAYRVLEFVLGVTAGVALRRGWRPRWSVRSAALAVAVSWVASAQLFGPLFTSEVRADRPLGNLFTDLLMVLPLAALIVAVAVRDVEGGRSGLRSRLLVRLGEGSFAFYLVHSMVVLFAAELPFGQRFGAGVPLTLLTLLAALAVADLLHRTVERPVERRLRNRLREREARSVRPLS